MKPKRVYWCGRLCPRLRTNKNCGFFVAVPALAADVEVLVARCEALEEAARDALDDWDNSSEEGFYGTKDGHKKMAALLKEKP